MLRTLGFIVASMMPVLTSCAAPTIDKNPPGRRAGLEIFVDGPRDLLSTFQLMRSDGEVWLEGPVRRPATEGKEARLLYATEVEPAISLIAQAYHSGAIDFSTINDFSETYARAKAALSINGKHSPALTYVEMGKGVFKLSTGTYGGLILSPANNWVFRAPVHYASNAITTIDTALKRIAFSDCGDYPKEDNSCTVSVFSIEKRVTEQLMELAGNVDDMKYSCDGQSLYILVKEFHVKSGPIDSLFALAGHPNSDNYYRLVIFSMQDRSETTLDVAGTYHPGRGYLVADCNNEGVQESERTTKLR